MERLSPALHASVRRALRQAWERLLKRRHAFGSSELNWLVLNTHLDTLATVLFVLRSVKLSERDRNLLISDLDSGAAALGRSLRCRVEQPIDPTHDSRKSPFSLLDTQFAAVELRIESQIG